MCTAGIIVALLLLAVIPAHADTGMYFCAVVVSGSCTTWKSVTEGILSLDELGITPSALIQTFAWGFGIVMVSFFVGRIAGAIAETFKNVSDGD